MTSGGERRDRTGQLSTRILEPLGAARIFLIDRTQWTVEEVADRYTKTRFLIFSTHGLARRVRTYPANWRSLSETELDALKEQV